MVMHARKTQRMSDGYFEKHQTHPYQNSNNKYTSSKPSYGSSNNERYEKFRDSPNNGTYRSESPTTESQSPRDNRRDRSYPSKSYLQKVGEKERENRDYKMSREKYSELSRSPKDKRGRGDSSEHSRITNNSDRNDDKSILHPLKVGQLSRDRKPMHNNCVEKREEIRDRVPKLGDWSEHVSSSGKKYYYNCKTEVSQWEKPREWIERERERERERFRGRERGERDDRYRDSSGRNMRHDKHSNSSRGSNGSNKDRHWNSSGTSRDNLDGSLKDSSSEWSSNSRRHSNPDNSSNIQSSSAQDMDISPGDSTPTSELSYAGTNSSIVQDQSVIVGPVLLANALPRLSSHPASSSTTMTPPGLLLSSSSTTINTSSPPHQLSQSIIGSNTGPGPPSLGCDLKSSLSSEPLTIDTNHHQISSNNSGGDGPPTPTHSEVSESSSKLILVPTTCNSTPTSGLANLQGVASSLQGLRPQGPTLTPSLSNYYRDDLVNHVRGWPADILEKQSQKLAEDAHIIGSIQCSKVSAELKSARSIVRLTEIQATLQEQRILFLRQQIKQLEELKSQNSFMSDDP